MPVARSSILKSQRNRYDFIVNEQTRFMFVNNKKLFPSFK
jgi:hypothetical protein